MGWGRGSCSGGCAVVDTVAVISCAVRLVGVGFRTSIAICKWVLDLEVVGVVMVSACCTR
jgi:hypothetical protein